MRKVHDLTGKRFGRLTVLERAKNINRDSHSAWLCKCDCGTIKTVIGRNLTKGVTKSCGCLQKEVTSRINRKHGATGSKLHNIWRSMKSRCKHESFQHYMNYGGKGISVCEEWENSFECFREWAVCNGYKEGLSIDRINVNGNYEPNNCRWIPMKEQFYNRGLSKASSSGHTGVTFEKSSGKWVSQIGVNGKNIKLGRFSNINDAIRARKDAEIRYWRKEG